MKEEEALKVIDSFIKQKIEWARANWPTEVEAQGVELQWIGVKKFLAADTPKWGNYSSSAPVDLSLKQDEDDTKQKEVPSDDAKILIDSPTWRDLINDIASFHVEESALDDPWEEDEHGRQYTEDAQNKYIFACDAAEEMIGQYFIRDEDDL
tara:strand:+ start:331 stop:786 length:456 start_codon:yes stop_codon:yes gene_type:complete